MSVAQKLDTIANNIPLVYQAGVSDGKQQQWNYFWDIFQDNGNRTDYTYAFRNKYWDSTTFKPKYSIIPTISGYAMFEQFNAGYTVFDLASHLDALGISLDLSAIASAINLFYFANISRVPVLNIPLASSLSCAFSYSSIVTIDKLVLNSNGTQDIPFTFNGMAKLKNIVIEGAIGKTGAVLTDSTKLSKASIISFINALLSTATGKSITFSLASVKKAFETSLDANNGSTSPEWTSLVATKSKWTITLA